MHLKSFTILALGSAILLSASLAQAAVTSSGGVNPADPTTWTSTTSANIGENADGSVIVNGGSTITSSYGEIGYTAGDTGTVTIDGSGSEWTNANEIDVDFNNGYPTPDPLGAGILNATNGGAITTSTLDVGLWGGSGTVNITNGGAITSAFTTVGNNGTINVGGTASLGHLIIGGSESGTLNIINGGTLTSVSAAVEVGSVLVSGAGSTWKLPVATDMNVGIGGSASLTINSGGLVSDRITYLGFLAGSTGIMSIDGAGSTLYDDKGIYVAENGTGKLIVTNGGTISTGNNPGAWGEDTGAYIGLAGATGTGVAIVDGKGSTWTNGTQNFNVGQMDPGNQLSIGDGGTVNSGGLSVYNGSQLTIDVGRGSSVNLQAGTGYVAGTGTFTNSGTLRMVVGAGAANGTYTPITAATWADTGIDQVLGGVYNQQLHTVTVSSAATGVTGTPVNFDLSQTQRALITDAATGKSIGAGFMAATSSTPVTFGATLLTTGSELAALQKAVNPSGESILSDWSISVTGTTISSTTPTYFSLFAGKGQSILNDLEIWGYNGSSWTQLTANDLAYDGTYASFTATSLQDLAVTGADPAPIPAPVWLFSSGLLGLIGLKRKFLG